MRYCNNVSQEIPSNLHFLLRFFLPAGKAADDNKASSCSDDSGSAGGYFPQKTYLTVSGQLQLEAAAG